MRDRIGAGYTEGERGETIGKYEEVALGLALSDRGTWGAADSAGAGAGAGAIAFQNSNHEGQ